jgi:hypothetical protein
VCGRAALPPGHTPSKTGNCHPEREPIFNSHNVVMTGRKNSFAKIQDLHSVADTKNSANSLSPSMAPEARGIMCGTFRNGMSEW